MQAPPRTAPAPSRLARARSHRRRARTALFLAPTLLLCALVIGAVGGVRWSGGERVASQRADAGPVEPEPAPDATR